MDLFDNLVSMGSRAIAEREAMSPGGFGWPVTSGGEQGLCHLGGLIVDPGQHARVLAVDLSIPTDVVIATDFDRFEALAAFKFEGRRIFRKVAVNRQPMIVPTNEGGDWIAPRASEALINLRGDEGFMERLNAFLIRTAVQYENSEHVEENIYQGFPSRADSVLLHEFHRVSWVDRFSILNGFEDKRYKQLGQRLIAEHQPSALPVSVRERFENWVLERRTWNEDAPWNTEPKA